MKKKILSMLLAVSLVSASFPMGTKAEEVKPKNVIYMIGDGMGQNHVQLTQWYWQGPKQQLNVQNMPVLGFQTNYSADNAVTDSAASGTALACGQKTNNYMVGQSPSGAVYTNLMEVAKSQGMATGIVSTAAITDATPAAFSAHDSSRNNQTAIAADQAVSGIDVIMGGGKDYYSDDIITSMQNNGYTYATNRDEMNAVPNDGKVLGLFNGSNMTYAYPTHATEPTIVEMTEKALDMLKGRSEDGFALMVEGACIDKASHSNLYDDMVGQNKLFDEAIKVALDFAKEDGNTLVVVTADHETGGLAIMQNTSLRNGRTKYEWTSGNHSGAHIPVYAYGPTSEVFTGMYDNTDIVKKISAFLGFTEDMWGISMETTTQPDYGTEDTAKNMIYVIGSGMGQNQLHYTQLKYLGSYEWMNIQTLPVNGLMSTYSADNGTTDDVAAGEALATGRKTANGVKSDRDNILDIAQSLDKATGIITDSTLTDDTIQAFVPKADLTVSEENSTDLQASVEQALESLKDSENGFTLVIESDSIDQYAKANDAVNMMAEILELDNAVGSALEFAKEDGDTMVVVTADHETGSMVLPDAFRRTVGYIDTFRWHSQKVSPTNVPVYAYGPASFAFTGVYDNTDLFYKVVKTMGADMVNPGANSVMGDMNQDSKVTPIDALIVLKYVIGDYTLTGAQESLADMNGVNGIKMDDVLMILEKASVIEKPVEERFMLTSTVNDGVGTVKFYDGDQEVSYVTDVKSVKVVIEAGEGYEIGKVDSNGNLINANNQNGVSGLLAGADLTGSRYEGYITVADDVDIEAWFDPAGRLTMTEISAEEQQNHTSYLTDATKWAALSDGKVNESVDVSKTNQYIIFDAGEGKKYNLTQLITYARLRYPGRMRYALWGSDALDWDLTATISDSNCGSAVRFTNTTNDSDGTGRFGGGSWSGNVTGSNNTSVRKNYTISGSYRYIILQADNSYSSSASEIKFYGTIE